jgi:acetyltransferase
MISSNLEVFFRPRGVAVIGASRDPQKLGHGVVRNLIQYGYDGPIYPINPRATDILERRAYASVMDAPDPLDLAVIVVPARGVPAELETCGQRGIKAGHYRGGFRETGAEGATRNRRSSKLPARPMRLLGPNGIGSIDTHTPLNTTFVKGMPTVGDIAFLSQSGAVCAAVIDWARGGCGFSLGFWHQVIRMKSRCTIASDPQTRVVAAYIEVSNGAAFAGMDSPPNSVIAPKVTQRSAKAVASHTGALAGHEEAYEAAFRRAGVLRAHTMEELFDWGRALAWQPLPENNRVAILTNSGGPGILACDALDAVGMRLAPLRDETKAYIEACPGSASVNPVDILAGPGPGTYALCMDALLSDDTVDAVVAITAPQDWFEPVSWPRSSVSSPGAASRSWL